VGAPSADFYKLVCISTTTKDEYGETVVALAEE
jgi:hypothetical protein